MKKVMLLFGVILLLIFSGCDSSSSAKKNGFELSSFNGGSDALTMKFGDSSPPDKVRDQSLQPFSVRILVENVGEYDIPEGSGYVTLSGFNPDDLGVSSGDISKPLQYLRGYKKQGSNVISGGMQQIVFDNLKYVNSAISGSYPFKFYANICYPYETKAFALICINGDTVPAIDDSAVICDLEGKKSYANSGGPVSIENVEQYPYGEHSIQIRFDIVHIPTSDDANVYEKGSIDSKCNIAGVSASSANALFKRDRVTYTVESNINGLNCESTGTGTNTVTLNGNKYTVTCIQDTTGEEEYEKPITILLDYDYLDRMSKTVTIEHVDI